MGVADAGPCRVQSPTSGASEFQVHFDDQGRVKEVSTDPMTRNLVVKE
jgi:hypothetical protein